MRSTLLSGTAAAVLITTALLGVAGCGGPVAGSGSAAPDGAGSPQSEIAGAQDEAQDRVGGSTVDNAVDACALLTEDDVEPYVGAGIEGRPNSIGGDGGSCTWENPDDYHSVTLEIGLSGTAAGGELPEWDDTIGPERPLSDGVRAWGGGQVEFVVDTRDCFLQVATTSGGDADEQAAVELIGKVRDQL